MRERSQPRIGENVYWISAAAAERCVRNRGKTAKTWHRLRLTRDGWKTRRADLFAQAGSVVAEVVAELGELVHSRFLLAAGLAIAGGVLMAGVLSLV